MKVGPKGFAVFGIAIAAVAVLVFINSPFFQFYEHLFVREHVRFSVPGTEFELEHTRLGTHPFLAEYDRWLTIVSKNGDLSKQKMENDTCGGYPIRCYLLRSKGKEFVRLHDQVSEHLVDLSSGEVYTIVHFRDGAFCGRINAKSDGTPRFDLEISDSDGAVSTIKIGDMQAIPMREIVDEVDGTYFGYLDGKVGRLEFTSEQE